MTYGTYKKSKSDPGSRATYFSQSSLIDISDSIDSSLTWISLVKIIWTKVPSILELSTSANRHYCDGRILKVRQLFSDSRLIVCTMNIITQCIIMEFQMLGISFCIGPLHARVLKPEKNTFFEKLSGKTRNSFE